MYIKMFDMRNNFWYDLCALEANEQNKQKQSMLLPHN